MGFIERILQSVDNKINEAKINWKVNMILVPFLNVAENKLKKIEIINDDLTKYQNIVCQISGISKYITIYSRSNNLFSTINNHNLRVEKILKAMSNFSYELIIENPKKISKKDLLDLKSISELIDDFSLADKEYKDKSSLIKDLYNNWNEINRQYDNLIEDNIKLNKLKGSKYYDFNEREKIVNDFIDNRSVSKSYYNFLEKSDINNILVESNKEFIEANLNDYIFNNVNGKKLDANQKRAILQDEVQNLVIAGAGCGKTLTICGKVKYLCEISKVNPNDILVLSYNKDTALDLQQKLSSISPKIKVATFHALGNDIIYKKKGIKNNVDEQFNLHINNYFYQELVKDSKMMEKVLMFYGLYLDSYSSSNVDFKNEGEYFEYLKSMNMKTLKDQFSSNKVTFKEEIVKSYEELALANFYFLNGIKYTYEKPYEMNTASYEKRQYNPDFYLDDYSLYHEHFGISKDGKAHQYSKEKGEKYIQDMNWKRNIHLLNGTKCIETYSYQFTEGDVFEKLKHQLKENGVKFNLLSNDEIYNYVNKIINNHDFSSFIRLVSSFIGLYKSRYENEEGFDSILEKYKFASYFEKNKAKEFLYICKKIYIYYREKLKLNNCIDFDDMILESIKYIKEFTYDFKFKYIIVDEFQDISYSRMKFLKALMNHGNSKLFVVGDDWQSIYRFTGCDLSYFTRFKEIFPNAAINRITQTFRNSQELQNIVEPFITKNSEQFKKHIKSDKSLEKPVRIMQYDMNKPQAFIEVVKDIYKKKSNGKLLVLIRNNKDIETIISSNVKIDTSDGKIYMKDFPTLNIEYKTVHSSKGLEAEFVILVNAENDKYGFPNKIEDNKLLSMVLGEKSNFEYAEERRLFYVALTRTQTYTYILVPLSNPSIFIEEIKKDCLYMDSFEESICDNQDNCPSCKSGKLVIRKDQKGLKFYGCTNFPYCKKSYTLKTIEANIRCPICNDYLEKRYGRYGYFYRCKNQKCSYTESCR